LKHAYCRSCATRRWRGLKDEILSQVNYENQLQ